MSDEGNSFMHSIRSIKSITSTAKLTQKTWER